MAISVSGTTITFNDATTQTTAGKSGTVTSVATGNGLSGGTITTTGTLVVACPSFNSVGSYCFVLFANVSAGGLTSGSNYSAGTGADQVRSATTKLNVTNNLSGTWKWMAGSLSGCDTSVGGIACRVS